MMAAGVDVMGLRITARVVCNDQGVQLAEDRDLRTRLSGVEICVESRDVAGLGQRVSKLLKMLFHVGRSLPFAVSRRRCPQALEFLSYSAPCSAGSGLRAGSLPDPRWGSEYRR